MNCADYLVDYLIKKGVTDVFGFSGGYIVPFIDALYKRKKEINTHVCYNEQGCAFAANGYARISGSLGVYFTTSGPGAVNAFGGLADAWFDGIPVMGICGILSSFVFLAFYVLTIRMLDDPNTVAMQREILRQYQDMLNSLTNN